MCNEGTFLHRHAREIWRWQCIMVIYQSSTLACHESLGSLQSVPSFQWRWQWSSWSSWSHYPGHHDHLNPELVTGDSSFQIDGLWLSSGCFARFADDWEIFIAAHTCLEVKTPRKLCRLDCSRCLLYNKIWAVLLTLGKISLLRSLAGESQHRESSVFEIVLDVIEIESQKCRGNISSGCLPNKVWKVLLMLAKNLPVYGSKHPESCVKVSHLASPLLRLCPNMCCLVEKIYCWLCKRNLFLIHF